MRTQEQPCTDDIARLPCDFHASRHVRATAASTSPKQISSAQLSNDIGPEESGRWRLHYRRWFDPKRGVQLAPVPEGFGYVECCEVAADRAVRFDFLDFTKIRDSDLAVSVRFRGCEMPLSVRRRSPALGPTFRGNRAARASGVSRPRRAYSSSLQRRTTPCN